MTVANVFTVDLEDWYQGLEIGKSRWHEFESRVRVGCERLLALLAEANVQATFFTLRDIAERDPGLIRAIAAAGHEVGTHGDSHEFVYRQTPAELGAEFRRSIDALAALSGAPVVSYRAPFFSITRPALWALDVIADAGIRYDSSIIPVHNYRYGIPEAPRLPWRHRARSGASLVEFPVSTVQVLRQNLPAAGGAYFRIYPYALTRRLIARVNRAGWPVMFYIHPWEADPDHPRPPLPWRVRASHYHNLGRTAPRLRRLLRDFRFRPLRAAVADLDERGLIGDRAGGVVYSSAGGRR